MNHDDDLLYVETHAGLSVLEEIGYLKIQPADTATGKIGTVAAWLRGLNGLSPAEIRAGFDWLAANWRNEFGLKIGPAELRKAINASNTKGPGEAWDEIQRDGHHHLIGGGYFSNRYQRCIKPEWSCPEIAAAVAQMGGIEACLGVTEDKLPTVRAQFREVWAGIQTRKQTRATALPQPPQAPAIAPPPAYALPPGSSAIVDLPARRAQMQAAIQAQKQEGLALVRQTLEEVEARKLAAYQQRIAEGQAKVAAYEREEAERQARIAEQKRIAIEYMQAEGTGSQEASA